MCGDSSILYTLFALYSTIFYSIRDSTHRRESYVYVVLLTLTPLLVSLSVSYTFFIFSDDYYSFHLVCSSFSGKFFVCVVFFSIYPLSYCLSLSHSPLFAFALTHTHATFSLFAQAYSYWQYEFCCSFFAFVVVVVVGLCVTFGSGVPSIYSAILRFYDRFHPHLYAGGVKRPKNYSPTTIKCSAVSLVPVLHRVSLLYILRVFCFFFSSSLRRSVVWDEKFQSSKRHK